MAKFLKDIVGMEKEESFKLLDSLKHDRVISDYRITEENGLVYAVTDDFDPTRVNIIIESDKIKSYDFG